MMFPTSSDEEIKKGYIGLKQQMPDATDDEILSKAKEIEDKASGGISSNREETQAYLRKKYGEQGMFGGDARAEVETAAEQKKSGLAPWQFLANVGGALAGKGGAVANKDFDQMRSDIDTSYVSGFDKAKGLAKQDEIDKRENDPNSEESKIAQDLAKSMGYAGDVSKLTAGKFKSFSPVMQKKYEIQADQRRQAENRQDRNYQKQLDRDAMQQARQDKSEEKQKAVDEKKKATLNEVEDRRRNIEDNLASLEDMIKNKGTYEAFGAHNADLDRKVDMIATDMAKLADPTSVARPSEVEMFKKGLVSSGATGMRNSTALDILKNFRGEIDSRVSNAYKIRGVDNPGNAAERGDVPRGTASSNEKVINGVKYKKVPGGWAKQDG